MSDRFKQLLDRLDQTKANTVGITTGSGIVNYNLEPYAKILYPVITPFRNSVPRSVNNNGGTGINWKAITAINPSGTPSTLREGRRGGYIDQTEADYSVNFATLGLENFVTEQEVMAAQGFDNALSIGQDNLLRAMMIDEEAHILGGNQSYSFGTPAAPAGTAGTGGSLPATATICKVVALSLAGYNRAQNAGAVVQTVTRTNGDGTSDVLNAGSSLISAASTAVTPAASGIITWTTTAIPGAFGYAWFTGTASGSLVYAGTTSINVFKQTVAASGTQTDGSLTNTDYSANPYAFNGLCTYASVGGGAYQSLNGATLTASGSGGVLEIDAFLSAFYLSRKVSPTCMWVNALDKVNIMRKVLSGPSGTGAYRVNINAGDRGIVGGSDITEYLNPFSPNGGSIPLPIKVHPNLPQGKILFDCENIPYPLANIPGARRMLLRRDYWSVLWPQVTMNRQFGNYLDGALQVYTPFALGILDNFVDG